MQFQCQPKALLAHRDLARHPGAEGDLGIPLLDALCQCQSSVVGNIEHSLDQLLKIPPEFGQRGVVVALHPQATRKLSQDERAHPLADLMDIDVGHHMGPPVRREQAVNQGLQSVGLAHDDLGVLGQLARLDVHFQQLRSATDAAQRIFDFMGQVADQLSVGLGLADHAFFAVLARLLLLGQQLDQHLVGLLAGRHNHMHWGGFLVGAQQAGVVAQG